MRGIKNILYISIVFIVSMGFEYESNSENLDRINYEIDNSEYLSYYEKEMMKEVNTARMYPKKYLEYTMSIYEETRQDSVRLSAIVSESIKKRVVYEEFGEVVTIDTTYNNYYNSRISAIRDLINDLVVAKPLKPLLPIKELYLAASKHGDKQAANNYIGHQGADGSWPLDRIKREAPWAIDGNENIVSSIGNTRDVVLQLLIDSGVESRGHRDNILNPNWKYFTCHNVEALNNKSYKWWIQEFAY